MLASAAAEGNAMTDRDECLYRYRVERGRCPKCGRKWSKEENGTVTCPVCLERKREEEARRRARLIEAGLCSRCGAKPARDGRRMCADCAEYVREKDKEKYMTSKWFDNVKAGMCANCGIRPPRPGMRTCRKCAMASHESYERRKIKNGTGQGRQGRHPMYDFHVRLVGIDKDVYVGNAAGAARFIGCTTSPVYQATTIPGRVVFGKFIVERTPRHEVAES